MLKLGFIINPLAGIGGKVGLKGSDGADIISQAFARGASPQAINRARQTLEILQAYSDKIHFFTASGEMGESLLSELNFNFSCVHQASTPSSAQDTVQTALQIKEQKPDLILFAGGDGTARDLYQAIGQAVPVLGIPAGVKIHSGVYAITPKAAGLVVELLLKNQLVSLLDTSVMDIDEAAFRQGSVRAKQYGEMQVPAEHRYIQATKSGSKEAPELVLQDIAEYLIEQMEDDCHYLIGSGTTCAALMDCLDLPNTLLGIDWVHQEKLIQADVHEKQILEILDTNPEKVKVIITIIGGQGHIIGRGNQQLSAQVLSKLGRSNLIIISTKTKLNQLNGRPLTIDSDSAQLNQEFSGQIKVVTGYDDFVFYSLSA